MGNLFQCTHFLHELLPCWLPGGEGKLVREAGGVGGEQSSVGMGQNGPGKGGTGQGGSMEGVSRA